MATQQTVFVARPNLTLGLICYIIALVLAILWAFNFHSDNFNPNWPAIVACFFIAGHIL